MASDGFVRNAVKNRFLMGIAILAAIGGFLFGYDTGIIAGALLFIGKQLDASKFEQSWIVASLLIGAMIGAAIAGYLADKISRKWTKAISGAVYVVGALGSAFAPNVPFLIGSRFVLGLAVGTASFVSPLYISEHAPKKIRGGTVTFNQLMVTLGILAAYLVAFALRDVDNGWRWMLGLAVIPGAALFIGMLVVPHSPRWLMDKGREDEARRVLAKTRSEEEVEEEIRDIRDTSEAQGSTKFSELFAGSLRPLMVIGLGLAIFQQLIGVNTVIYYSTTILHYTGLSVDSSVAQAVAIGVTNVVFTIIAVLLLDRVGRRKLLLTGTVGCVIGLAVLGFFFWRTDLAQQYGWIALAALVFYIAAFAIGLGPVFWLMISEIYPMKIRSKAMAIATIANWGFNFLISYFFLSFVSWFGKTGTFWIYAVLGIIATVFFAMKLPETKDRSLEEITSEAGVDTGAATGSGSDDSAPDSTSADDSTPDSTSADDSRGGPFDGRAPERGSRQAATRRDQAGQPGGRHRTNATGSAARDGKPGGRRSGR